MKGAELLLKACTLVKHFFQEHYAGRIVRLSTPPNG
jgi:hypothetical protein